MAHFAKLDENNVVIQVVTISNNELLDENGQESEQKGIQFCKSLFGGDWIQTSYNNNFRKNYAGIGMTYDSQRNAFIPIKPFNSWILNELNCRWEAPIAMPDDKEEKNYIWDEDSTSWIDFVNQS